MTTQHTTQHDKLICQRKLALVVSSAKLSISVEIWEDIPSLREKSWYMRVLNKKPVQFLNAWAAKGMKEVVFCSHNHTMSLTAMLRIILSNMSPICRVFPTSTATLTFSRLWEVFLPLLKNSWTGKIHQDFYQLDSDDTWKSHQMRESSMTQDQTKTNPEEGTRQPRQQHILHHEERVHFFTLQYPSMCEREGRWQGWFQNYLVARETGALNRAESRTTPKRTPEPCKGSQGGTPKLCCLHTGFTFYLRSMEQYGLGNFPSIDVGVWNSFNKIYFQIVTDWEKSGTLEALYYCQGSL